MKGDSAMSRYYSSRANDLTIFSPPPDSLVDELSLISRSDVYLMKQIDIAIRSANSRWAVDLLQHGLIYLSDNKYFVSRAVKQFLSVGMSKAALPYIDRHFSFFGDDTGELLETGRLLADAGLTDQAGRYLRMAFDNSKNNADVQSEIALLFVQKGMKQDGLNLMTGLLKEAQNDAKIASDAAFMYLELNDRENTVRYLDLLKRLSPGDVKLDILGAIISEKDGKTGEAISFYMKAFMRDPKNIYVIDHLSNIYLKEKQWGKAVAFLKKALTIYPNSSALQERLGGLLVACPDAAFRNIPEGKEYSERAFINYNYTVPTRISAGRNLAIAYYNLGDIKNARSYIEKTVRIAENTNVSKDYMQNLESLLQEFSR
jgi:tetratricopeptide (TPR) repeat protein